MPSVRARTAAARLLARRRGSRCAELHRKRQPIGVEVHHHHVDLGEDGLQHEEMQQPHAAGAEHNRDSLRAEPGALDAAQHASGGLHEDRALVGKTVRHFSRRKFNGARADQDGVGEAAGLHQILLEDFAHRLVAAAAIDALPQGT